MPVFLIYGDVVRGQETSKELKLVHGEDVKQAVEEFKNSLLPRFDRAELGAIEMCWDSVQCAIDASNDDPDDAKTGLYVGYATNAIQAEIEAPPISLWREAKSKQAVFDALESEGAINPCVVKIIRSAWQAVLPHARTPDEIRQEHRMPNEAADAVAVEEPGN
jgi:hypothetical protein